MSHHAQVKPDFYIQFSDRDVRGIPQGYRGVTVVKMGWKWVSCRLTATGKPFKMRRGTWDEMTKHPVEASSASTVKSENSEL
jgi:hypothetical protein